MTFVTPIRPEVVWMAAAADGHCAVAGVGPVAALAGFPGPAARPVAVWAAAAEVLGGYWAEAAAEAEVWVPRAATVVEFQEVAGWPAVALARLEAGSAVTGPAAIVLAGVLAGHWSVRVRNDS